MALQEYYTSIKKYVNEILRNFVLYYIIKKENNAIGVNI